MKHDVHIKNVLPSYHAAAVLLERTYRQIERRQWNKARKSFLDEEVKKKGVLTCFYCNKTNLKRKGGKPHEKATVDHVVPKSKGGSELEHSNFVVSCEGCNRKKSNESKESFLKSKYLSVKKKSKA